MNEVNFYEPFMEEPAILPGRPLSEMDIVEFVNQHRRLSRFSFFISFFLKGYFHAVESHFEHLMRTYSPQGYFEEAAGREYV